MSMQSTPSANRIHIGIFGRRNAGKSSLMNALTGQNAALVSPVAGTTTDPVSKSMELFPMGPVVLLDTPGLDDSGELGMARVRRGLSALEKTDIALIVVDAGAGVGELERDLIEKCAARNIPHIVVHNKSDASPAPGELGEHEALVSALTGQGVDSLLRRIADLGGRAPAPVPIVADLLSPGDLVVLITPIDGSAPKGRLILPQQQTLRDVLDANAQALVAQEATPDLFTGPRTPRLVITDSQVFAQASAATPRHIPLTSFSILFARHKGILEDAVRGVRALESLPAGATILISEGCTHHRQCEDIGTVKLPKWICGFTGKDFQFEFTSGGGFPEDLSPYGLVVHCGGCMLTERTVRSRLQSAKEQGVPMTNYGTLIAHMNGILRRSIAPFPEFRDK